MGDRDDAMGAIAPITLGNMRDNGVRSVEEQCPARIATGE